MKLHIFLRTCTHSNVHFRDRFLPLPKDDLILLCLKSLLVSLQPIQTQYQVSIRVIDDHSEPVFLQKMEAILKLSGLEFQIQTLTGRGNNASMKECYQQALAASDGLIYFLEDDYLHSPECFFEMLGAYHHFRAKLEKHNPRQSEVVIMPVDNQFHYQDNTMFISALALGPFRHWRQNFYSNWTMLMSRRALQLGWSGFWRYSDYELSKPETHEDATLVPIFRSQLTLFTPVPTLALHVASAPYVSPFVNEKEWWDRAEKDWRLYEQKAYEFKNDRMAARFR